MLHTGGRPVFCIGRGGAGQESGGWTTFFGAREDKSFFLDAVDVV